MKTLITRIKRLALALCFVTPLVSWAAGGSATNPVTGAAESYQYYFVGGDATNPGDWATQANWKVGSDDSDYTTLNKNYAPAIYINNNSGETYGTVLFDGVNCPDNKTITSTGSKVEGWTFKIGAYNGVDVTIDHLDLWSAGAGNVGSSAASVDATSKITIKEINNGKNWPSTIDYYIAANEGLTYKGAFRPTGGQDVGTIRYWFAGAGSVVYEDVVEKCAHVIKQADVTLTGGAKEVKSKTLVTFASTTKTFSADNALITVKNSGGTTVRGVLLSSVTSGTTTLTTDNNVGDCELVQTATGVLLYYVDGDAAAAVITYTPSISINFRDSDSNTLNTFADVGLTGYAVPGNVWNNYTIPDNANEQTFNTVNQIDSAGDSSEVPGATVTVSGHRGRYYCSSLDASLDPRRGYIDDGNSAETMSPSVTITGIPYDNYRVIVYHATDSNGALFGYDTINGTDFTYVDGQQTIGTTGWGASGAQNTALPIQEGVNTLVSGILSGSTVTMVAHRMSNPTARGCFAAIQVVEVAVNDSDLVINVNGNTEYEVTESKQYDNVIIAGTGNLTFTGEGTITADTLNIDPVAAVVKVNSTQLSVSKVIGNGVALYEGALPPDGDGWWTDASEWKGTVWIKNYTTKLSAFESNKYGNNSSVLRLTGLNGYLQRTTTAAPYTHMTLELVDDGDTPAFTYNDGWGGSAVYISALKGNGTFAANSAGNGEIVYVADPSAFTGSFNLTHKKVQLGGSAPNGDNQNWNGKILIPSGATATVASGKTWYAGNGIEIEGTLTSNGALDVPTGKSIAVSGSLVNTGTIGIYGGVSVAANGTLTNNGRIWAVGGITVNGTLKTDKYTTTDSGRFGSGTAITLGDTGVFELASTGNTDDGSTSYSQITGTGKIKYSGSGYWVLSSNHPTAITLEAEQASALVVPAAGATIGSLTGTKGFRSDWGDTPAAGRYLTIKQFKDTSWSGSINQTGGHRLTGVVVDPGESTTGTLEVTGTQTASATLTVNGSVNLTGTWVGATTVSGTFGGTGTLTGDLTFSDGATFKAFASGDEDGLVVSGTVGYPAEGTVTVDVSAIEPEADVALLKAADLDASKFALAEGTPEGYRLDVVEGVLTLKLPVYVTITVPTVDNATVAVTVGGVAVQPITEGGNTYQVEAGSQVSVTYAAASGYAISGTTQYTIDTTTETTFEITDTATAQYVARVRNYGTNLNEDFTSLNEAIAVADGTTYANAIMLLADITDAVTIDKAISLSCQGKKTISAAVTISSGGYLLLMGPTLTGKLTIGANGAYAQVGTGSVLPEVETQDGASIALNTLSADTVALTVTNLTVNGTLTLSATAQGTERGTPYKAFSYVTANATFGEGAEIVGDGEYSASTEVEGDNTVVSMTITAVAKIGDEYYDDLDEAVADAIANDTVVELLIQPEAAVTLGVGQTLKVKAYSHTLEVNLASGLTNPPYSISSALDTGTTITTYTVNAAFAKIGNTTYPTLAAAIEAAESGDTVTLLANVTLDSSLAIPAGKSLTLNLNGYTLTGPTGKNYAIANSGNITLTGGTITGYGVARNVASGATITVTDGTYTATGANGFINVTDAVGCAVTINGGTFTAQEAVVATGRSKNSSITVNSGTLTSIDNAVLMDNGSSGYTGNTITVTGGIFNGGITTAGYVACGIYCANDTTVNVTGGTFTITGGCGILARAGKVSVSGTTVINTTGTATGKVGDSRIVVPCAPIVYDSAANYPGYDETTTTFAVSGGTFTANGQDVACIVHVADEGDAMPIAVTGGTFSSDVSDYCADGYEATETSTGVWTVAVVQEIPVEAGAQTEPVETRADAEEEAAKVVPSVPAAVAEALSDDQQTAYKALFEAKVVEVTVGETTKYAVEVALTEAAETALQTAVDAEAKDLADAAVAAAADATNGGSATVATTPGLYYVVEAGADIGAITPASCTLATGETTTLPVPNKGTSGFYKIRVSVTEVPVTTTVEP